MISRVRERERERERERVKTDRQADGFTLLIIILHKQTKILNVKSFMGFIVRKNQHSALHFWTARCLMFFLLNE